jgi:hypothetical protein
MTGHRSVYLPQGIARATLYSFQESINHPLGTGLKLGRR